MREKSLRISCEISHSPADLSALADHRTYPQKPNTTHTMDLGTTSKSRIHFKPLFFASLSLIALGYGAPVNPNTVISTSLPGPIVLKIDHGWLRVFCPLKS